MNLLNDIFDVDKNRIMEVNKKYMVTMIIIVLFVIALLYFFKKDCYYENKITNVGDNVVLIVEKEMINDIKNNKKIIIDGILNDYSINRIESLQDICFVYIKIDYKNINDNTYRIYLGKERVLDYIVRILKK